MNEKIVNKSKHIKYICTNIYMIKKELLIEKSSKSLSMSMQNL